MLTSLLYLLSISRLQYRQGASSKHCAKADRVSLSEFHSWCKLTDRSSGQRLNFNEQWQKASGAFANTCIPAGNLFNKVTGRDYRTDTPPRGLYGKSMLTEIKAKLALDTGQTRPDYNDSLDPFSWHLVQHMLPLLQPLPTGSPLVEAGSPESCGVEGGWWAPWGAPSLLTQHHNQLLANQTDSTTYNVQVRLMTINRLRGAEGAGTVLALPRETRGGEGTMSALKPLTGSQRSETERSQQITLQNYSVTAKHNRSHHRVVREKKHGKAEWGKGLFFFCLLRTVPPGPRSWEEEAQMRDAPLVSESPAPRRNSPQKYRSVQKCLWGLTGYRPCFL